MEVKLTFYQNEALDIELPTSVDLKVVQADAAVRGDTATGVTKKVTVETGASVDVPMFVKEGDVIRVDTRTGRMLPAYNIFICKFPHAGYQRSQGCFVEPSSSPVPDCGDRFLYRARRD